MASQDQPSPLRFAIIGFLIALVIGVLIEIMVFEGDLGQAAISAGSIGVGVGIGFYLVQFGRVKRKP